MEYFVDAKLQVVDFGQVDHDIFVSAYNDSTRVRGTFSAVSAKCKHWWIIPEYDYTDVEVEAVPAPRKRLLSRNESDLVIEGLEPPKQHVLGGARLCVDIIGFMRSHILFLMFYLRKLGVAGFDALYTEPQHYSRKVDTTFARRVTAVREVEGFIGQHQTEVSNDVLLLGVGYDNDPMGRAILAKENARLVQLHSLPSLSADMYHESLLRLDRVGGVSRPADEAIYFASANDPYVTAAVLSQAWSEMNRRRPVTNLYLCPLATKAQVLGFGLFFLAELADAPASIILPKVEVYERETSIGVGRSWLYPVSLN